VITITEYNNNWFYLHGNVSKMVPITYDHIKRLSHYYTLQSEITILCIADACLISIFVSDC
jgi:hypothetical protein